VLEAPSAARWGSLEVFVVVLYLSSALLFVPGAQSVRGIIRGLPYASSLLLLGWWLTKGGGIRADRPGAKALLCSLVLMGCGLVHPDANLFGGLGQILFQLSIVAPLFWMGGHAIDANRLHRLLVLIFLANAASAVVGLLQFLYPDRFMPPEFSASITRVTGYMEMLKFRDRTGRIILRPPGLTDMPGGAASGAAVTAVLGLLLAAQPGRRWQRLFCLALCGVGLVTLYFSFVRSMVMSVALIFGFLCWLLARQGRVERAVVFGTMAGAVMVGTFLLAVAFGGDQLFARFSEILDKGVVASFQSNRGMFVEYTLTRAVFDYPLGAGVGRWGMMTHYFGVYDTSPSPPLYAEIQITGWLFDGGIALLIAYPLAVLASLSGLYRMAGNRHHVLAFPALIAICMNLFIVIQGFAGPTFNTTGGMQYWLVAALVFRAAEGLRAGRLSPS
jgi:hypothetical protein